MKLIIASFALASGSTMDPCSQLCQFDGPEVCTGGSWRKVNEICHAYHYNDGGHCYHTAATRARCPAEGRPVRASEVPGIIAAHRTTTSTPTTSNGADPLQVEAEEFPFTPTLKPAEDSSLFPFDPSELDVSVLIDTPATANLNSLIRRLAQGDHDPEALADLIVSIFEKDLGHYDDPVSQFFRLKGHVMLSIAARADVDPAFAVLPFLVGFNIRVPTDVQDRFATEAGLRLFCDSFPEKATKAFLRHHIDMDESRMVNPRRRSLIRASVLMYLPLFCPQLLEASLELRVAYSVERIWWSIGTFESSFPLHIRTTRETLFAEDIPQFMSKRPQDLRMLTNVIFGRDSYGREIRREWFSRALGEVFGAQGETAAFMKTEDGLNVIQPTGNLREYRRLGRFLAMCLINEQTIGLKFPVVYIARLLGVPVTLDMLESEDPTLFESLRMMLSAPVDKLHLYSVVINGEVSEVTVENREQLVQRKINSVSSPEEEERLTTLVLEFQSVIPPGSLSDMLSVEDLSSWFSGSTMPRIE